MPWSSFACGEWEDLLSGGEWEDLLSAQKTAADCISLTTAAWMAACLPACSPACPLVQMVTF